MKPDEINATNDTTGIEVPAFYLPPVSFFATALPYLKIAIIGEERFRKSSLRSRCSIGGANGKLLLSIPLVGGRNTKQKVKDVRILNEEPWQRIHWNSITSSYGKSSFFLYYCDRFQPFYQKQFDFLLDFNFQLLKVCFEILGWEGSIELNNENQSNSRFPQLDREPLQTQKSLIKKYHQVFTEKHGFIPDLSIVDLIFNLGRDAYGYLKS